MARIQIGQHWVKSFLVVLVAIGLLLIAGYLPLGTAIRQLELSVRELGIWGPLLFVLVYAVAVTLLVPAWPLTVTAGAVFGLVLGTILASLAATAGAGLAFLVARYLARDWVAETIRGYPKFEAIDQAIGEGGWKIVALLRLSPAIPFNLQNYLYGLTRIRFWPYLVTSWIAMLPGAFLYVYLGHVGRLGLAAASEPGRTRSAGEWALIVVGLVATLAVTVYITHRARRAMQQHQPLAADASHNNEKTRPQQV